LFYEWDIKKSFFLKPDFSLVWVPGTVPFFNFQAVVQWSSTVELSIPVSGVVKSVEVDTGERVAKGQVLAALDATPFEANLKQAQALVARRKAGRTEALRDYKQAQELFDRMVLSPVELENAKLKQDAAEAAYQGAVARLTRAQYDLEQSALRAPFDGWVLARHVVPGETVISEMQARTLFLFAAASRYNAVLQLVSADMEALRIGGEASVEVAGRRYPGRIRSIGLTPTGAEGAAGNRYEVTVAFSVADRLLRAGQAATVSFP